jgi:NAD(P)-dependent dehydrogenase (short-subunit alcohol dehydrogenase family)
MVASTYRTIDVLVNNAGLGGHRQALHEYDMVGQIAVRVFIFDRVPINVFSLKAGFDAIMAVNVRAPFSMMQQAIRQMRECRSGCIINFASTAGHRASKLAAPYSISKSAVLAMTRCAAAEYSSEGIRINSISPGALERPNIQGFSTEVS